MKETFIVRTEWFDAISELSNEDQLIIFQNMFHFHMDNNNLINLNNLSVKLVWKLILPNIERNINLYDKRKETSRENGLKGGRPSKNQQDTSIPAESEKPNKPNPETYYPTETLSVSVSVPVSASVPDIANDFNTDASLVFEGFRVLYPGTKRGLQTEFKTFQKHKDWKAELPKLEPAIKAEILDRQVKKSNNSFVPEWPMLSTYLNQRRWEAVPEATLNVSLNPKGAPIFLPQDQLAHPLGNLLPKQILWHFDSYQDYQSYCKKHSLEILPQED